MRSRWGPNNNPTAREFKAIYKRLLLGVTNFSVEGSNVLIQDNSEMVAVIPSPQNKIDFIVENYCLSDFDFDQIGRGNCYSEFKTNVIEYIAGYVVKKTKDKISCSDCVSALVSAKNTFTPSLITTRDYGNFMSYPSKFANTVLKRADNILEEEMKTTNWLQKKYFFDYVCLKIAESVVDGPEFRLPCNHGYELILKISSCYTCIKLKHCMKLKNEEIRRSRLRRKLTRIIINNHE